MDNTQNSFLMIYLSNPEKFGLQSAYVYPGAILYFKPGWSYGNWINGDYRKSELSQKRLFASRFGPGAKWKKIESK